MALTISVESARLKKAPPLASAMRASRPLSISALVYSRREGVTTNAARFSEPSAAAFPAALATSISML